MRASHAQTLPTLDITCTYTYSDDVSDSFLSESAKREVAQNCVHFNLKRSVRSVTQQFDTALAQEGVHITQFTLLVTSSLLGAVPVSELADKLALDRTTLTRNLKPLEQKGWVKTTVSDIDARMRLVEITSAGEALVARSYPLWKQVQGEVTQSFDRERYKDFLVQLEQVAEHS